MGDTIIVPLVDVSFGVGASAKTEEKKNSGGGGMGGKISPSAVLVISNGTTRLVNVKNQDSVTKILDMDPDSCEGSLCRAVVRRRIRRWMPQFMKRQKMKRSTDRFFHGRYGI